VRVTKFARATALVLLLVLVTAGPTSARPHAPRHYTGTVTGSYRFGHVVESWTVSKVTYKLFNFRFARGSWGGNYRLTGGKVTYQSAETGECAYNTSGSLQLGKLPWSAANINFLQLRGSTYGYSGTASKSHRVAVTEKCEQAGEQYTSTRQINPAGGLWIQTRFSQKFRLGHRIKGHYTTPKDFRGGIESWSWNFAPKG
jgi:hypothetical protein